MCQNEGNKKGKIWKKATRKTITGDKKKTNKRGHKGGD